MSAFYDQASLVVVPSGYKSGKIYAQKPLTTDGQLTFTRASTATRVNASGLIESVASGVPRLDYLNSTCPKLLLEPQRSNLVLQSESFNNAAWTKTNATVTANAATSPDGYVNADKLITNNAAANGQVNQTISKAATATTYTISAFAKKDEWDQAYLYISDSASFANRLQAFFNIETGTLIQANAFGTFTAASGKIENYGNGWYRISATVTTSTETSILARIYSIDSVATVGDGTSGIYIWGAMLESGAYATSYLKTEAAAVTRLAEVSSKTGVGSLIGTTEGAFFIDFIARADNTNSRAITITGGSQELLLFFEPAGTGNIGISSSTSGFRYIEIGGASDKRYKIAYAWKANNYALFVNGVEYSVTQTASTFTGLDRIDLNQTQSGAEIGKTVLTQLLLFKTRLTNAQLAELTTL
jgi:hypothetical protein